MVDESFSLHVILYGSLKFWVTAFVERDSREQVIDQRQEKWLVLIYKFGQVHVPQNAHDDCLLCVMRA